MTSLELLEQRRLLAVYVISSTFDGPLGAHEGELTLREALVAANTNAPHGDAPAGDEDGDVIIFDESLAGDTLGLDGGLGALQITDDLSLNVDGPQLTISGGNRIRLFEIDTGETVAIANLTLANGRSEFFGGGMTLDGGGSTTLDNVVMRDNWARGLPGGGAISNADHNLAITNSRFENNIADIEVPGPGPGNAVGGAIGSSGDLTISGSHFEGNGAEGAGGAINASGNVTITGSTFSSNAATALTPGHGGAIRFMGPNLSIDDSQFTGNQAASAGGAIYNAGGVATISNSSFQANQANHGGGIYNTGSMDMTGLVLSGNRAAGDDPRGGGFYNDGGNFVLRDSEVVENRAEGEAGRGGGGFSEGDTVIFDTLLSRNSADQGGGIYGGRFGIGLHGSEVSQNTARLGGGLYITGPALGALVVDSTIQDNLASRQGGGFWVDEGSFLTANRVQVLGNVASGASPGDGGGGVFNSGGILAFTDSDISRNTVAGAGGGIFSEGGSVTAPRTNIEQNQADLSGGGAQVEGGSFTLELGSNVVGNVAGTATGPRTGTGGGLSARGEGTQVVISQSFILDNVASNSGGGIHNVDGSSLTVNLDSDVNRNSAFADGGGIYNAGATLLIDFSDVFDNTAFGASGERLRGGGIFSAGGDVTITASQIKRNGVSGDGGGLAMEGGTLSMFLSDFSDNIAGSTPGGERVMGDGGGIYLFDGASADIDSSKLEGNVASTLGTGGGLWMSADSTAVVNMTYIAGNRASSSGGGVFNDGGQLTFSRSRAWDNLSGNSFSDPDDVADADGDGGGLYLGEGGVADVSVSSIRGNRAPDLGGGIYSDAALAVNFTAINNNFAGDDGGGIFADDDGETDLIDAFLFANEPNNIAGPGA